MAVCCYICKDYSLLQKVIKMQVCMIACHCVIIADEARERICWI